MTIKSRLCGVGHKWSFYPLTSGLFTTCVALLLALCLALPAGAVVSSSTARVAYNGNGSVTVFAVPFYFLDSDDLKVVLINETTEAETTQTRTTDYTVTGAGDASGGSVTMLTAPTSNEQLVIVRNMSALQPIDLTANAQLPAETLEVGYDRLTMLVQQNVEKLDRAFKFSEGYTGAATATIPSPTAGRYLRWNSSATALENVALTSDSLITVSAYGETLIAAATSAAARSILSVYSTAEVDAALAGLSTRGYHVTLYGTAEVGTEQQFFLAEQAGTITGFQVKCKTAPTGDSIILDVKINGTSIFATTPANRPTIAAEATTGSAGTPDTVDFSAGDRISVEYVQIGSGTAGADTMCTIVWE